MSEAGKYNDINDITAFVTEAVPAAYAAYRMSNCDWKANYEKKLPKGQAMTDEALQERIAMEFNNDTYFKCYPQTMDQHGILRAESYICSGAYSGISDDAVEKRTKASAHFLTPGWDKHGVLKAMCDRERGVQLNSLPIKDHDMKDIWGTDDGRKYLESITLGTMCSVIVSLKHMYPNPKQKNKFITVWDIEFLRILCAPFSAQPHGIDEIRPILSVTEILEQCRKRQSDDRDNNTRGAKRRLQLDQDDDDDDMSPMLF
jgi:hypothetical protein